MKKTSRNIIQKILFLRNKALSARKIREVVGCSLSTITKYCHLNGLTKDVSKRGRHAKVSMPIQRLVIRNFQTGIFKTSTDATRYLNNVHGLKLSGQTIRNVLAANGLRSYVRPLKPRLLTHHRRARYKFSKKMKLAPEDFWRSAVFTDETKFNLYGHDGPLICWRNPGSQLLDHHVRQVVKYGGGSVMAWGAITPRGVGKLVFVCGRMNADQYISILASGYLPTLDMHGYDVDHTFIIQDNDPKHVSRKALEWFCTNNVRVLEWPSCSPDMNIIENVWNDIKIRLRARPMQPQNITELCTAVEEEWYSTPVDYIKTLYNSIGRRISALYAARGSFTKY